MEYRPFGNTGYQVSAIGLGGNTFGRDCDERQTAEVVNRAIELGINHFDCADTYGGGGISEMYLGKAVASRRREVFITTKTGYPLGEGPNNDGLSKRRIINNLEDSLERLGTDYVDVFYLHRPDPRTDISESLDAADDLVRQGKVRYVACSNYPGWEIARMVERAHANNWSAPTVSQSVYNLFSRGIEDEVIPACEAYSMSIVPFSPLAGGLLTGKYQAGREVPENYRGHGNPRFVRLLEDDVLAVVARLTSFATERGYGLGQVAIAWLLKQPVVCSVITGVTSPTQVEENVSALECDLSAEDLVELDRITTTIPDDLVT